MDANQLLVCWRTRSLARIYKFQVSLLHEDILQICLGEHNDLCTSIFVKPMVTRQRFSSVPLTVYNLQQWTPPCLLCTQSRFRQVHSAFFSVDRAADWCFQGHNACFQDNQPWVAKFLPIVVAMAQILIQWPYIQRKLCDPGCSSHKYVGGCKQWHVWEVGEAGEV